MKNSREGIVADGQARIERSDLFRKRKQEIIQDLLEEMSAEIGSSGWFRKQLIILRLKREASRKAKEEMCPAGGLYLARGVGPGLRTSRERQ